MCTRKAFELRHRTTASLRWILLTCIPLVLLLAGACSKTTPPYQGMDVMVEESDLAVVGRVNSVGQLVLIEEDQQGVWYYDATLIVEETLFGSPRQQVPAVARRDSPIM